MLPAGRAVVELTVEKASGQAAFVDPNSAAGPQPRATLVLVLDGYSGAEGSEAGGGELVCVRSAVLQSGTCVCRPPARATCCPTDAPLHSTPHALRNQTCAAPVTAANLAANFQSGLYNGARLSVSGVSVLAGQPGAPDAEASGAAAVDGSEAAFREVSSGRRSPPRVLPLEILAAGDFEPIYRTPLDVRSGELPVLPLSIYGAGEAEQHGVLRLPSNCFSKTAVQAGFTTSGHKSAFQPMLFPTPQWQWLTCQTTPPAALSVPPNSSSTSLTALRRVLGWLRRV